MQNRQSTIGLLSNIGLKPFEADNYITTQPVYNIPHPDTTNIV